MKKAAILSIAAFYLLLTTGMYVCILHCSAEYFIQPKMAMNGANHQMYHAKGCKSCKDKDGCDCCKQHGNYIIKENIKPASEFLSQQFSVIIDHPVIPHFTQTYASTISTRWHDSNAPPWKSGKDISIRFRSLLI